MAKPCTQAPWLAWLRRSGRSTRPFMKRLLLSGWPSGWPSDCPPPLSPPADTRGEKLLARACPSYFVRAVHAPHLLPAPQGCGWRVRRPPTMITSLEIGHAASHASPRLLFRPQLCAEFFISRARPEDAPCCCLLPAPVPSGAIPEPDGASPEQVGQTSGPDADGLQRFRSLGLAGPADSGALGKHARGSRHGECERATTPSRRVTHFQDCPR